MSACDYRLLFSLGCACFQYVFFVVDIYYVCVVLDVVCVAPCCVASVVVTVCVSGLCVAVLCFDMDVLLHVYLCLVFCCVVM